MGRKKDFLKLYDGDLHRYAGKEERYLKKFHYYLRRAQTANNLLTKNYYHFQYKRIRLKNGIELSEDVLIGAGLYIGHPYNITVNSEATLGMNVNLHKGCLIEKENRGARKGAPIIGNNVWIGINAVVVGNISIGDDVLIAPNSYVNSDVPAHSIVFGNPCIIIEKQNATEYYINNALVVE